MSLTTNLIINLVVLFSCSFGLISANGEPSKGETVMFQASSFNYHDIKLKHTVLCCARGLQTSRLRFMLVFIKMNDIT